MTMPIFVIKILVLAFFLIIVFNILVYNLVVTAVVRKYIKPYLYAKNLIFTRAKFVGLFSQGDFDKGKFIVKPVPEIGKINNTTIFYIYAVDDKREIHQYSVKVSTLFLIIRKVILKSKKENIEVELTGSN